MSQEALDYVKEGEVCSRCGVPALSTYKQMILTTVVVEEGSDFDCGARLVLCGECKNAFYKFLDKP